MNWGGWGTLPAGPCVPVTPPTPPPPPVLGPWEEHAVPSDDDVNQAWLARLGWRSRYEDGGRRKGYWIDLMPERDVWLTLDEAVRLQTKILAGSARWL